MSQLERIAFLDRRIRERGWVTAADAARHFDVSPRQVKRDIEYLRWRLDAPLVYDAPRHRYHYEKPFTKLRFTDERRVLFAALVKGWASSDAYRTLVTPELLEALDANVARDYRAVADRIRYEAPSTDPVDLEVFAGLCRGLRDGRIVEIDYQNLSGEPSRRRVEAERLVNYAGVWYLVAFDHKSGELRTFHLGRIAALAVTGDPAAQGQVPGWSQTVEAWVDTGSGIFRGGEAYPATVRLRGAALRLALGQTWHSDQGDAAGSDDEGPYLDRTLPVVDTRELVGRVLAFGADGEALDPPAFRDQWRAQVRALALRANLPRH
jgi:predicted DNA-binding transcriptional regulator YafY